MPRSTFTIRTILGGWSPTEQFGEEGQFRASLAIDPDFPASETGKRTSGLLRPTAMEDFSSTALTDAAKWLMTNPKTTNTYAYLANGVILSYDSNLANETAVGTPTNGNGSGAAYYDNYLYFTTTTDVARYGPLNGSPSLTNSYWTSTLSKTALANTTYPTVRGEVLPNHVMHRHTDGKLYFTDVVGNQGVLHYIKTTKTTVEGDTDDTSTYNALDFPYGYYPTAIESYGTELAVAVIEGTDTGVEQGNAKLSFWDTTSSSYQKITDVEFPDPLITALKNVNGVLYVFSGSAAGGVRVSRFIGGYSFEEVAYLEEGTPPMQGAVDHILNRIYFGTYVTEPASAACVFAIGSKRARLGRGIQNVLKTVSAGATQNVTALKLVQQNGFIKPAPIVAWRDDSNNGIDKLSTTYGTSVWQSEVVPVGRPFRVMKLQLPLAQAMAANMTLTAKIVVDNGTTTHTLRTINNTNFPNSEKNILLYDDGIRGKHDFYLELTWSGSALCTVSLPISIELETEEDYV